ncbi:MAG: hypothetical protein SGJ20_06690 [Planctomycetota bacterium]|nr:hypothetical protein [Planctomycetota bacterium]
MKISAIWVESKSLHAFTQQFTSWSDLLANPLNYDEKQLRKLVDNMLALRWKMTVTANIQDPAKRATALKKIADSDCSTLQATAIKALGVCGEPALPILRDLISQRGFRGELALDAIVPAAEGKACEELVTLLESEQKFWKENASKLKEADWLVKCEPDEYRFLLYYRYKMTQSILQKLKVHPSQPARDAALSLRKFWQTLPMPSANQKCQMVEVCNQVISPEKSKSTSSSANLHWPTQASSAPSNYPRSLYIGARKNVR